MMAQLYGDETYYDMNYMDALLTEEGTKQSYFLHDTLYKNKPDLIYCSPLRRTIQTMFYSIKLKNSSNTDSPIIIDGRLRELMNSHPCNYYKGKYDVIAFTNKIQKDIDSSYNITYTDINKLDDITATETNNMLIQRGMEWYNDMLSCIKDNPHIKNIYCYSHGEFINIFVNHLLTITPSNNKKLYWLRNSEIYSYNFNL